MGLVGLPALRRRNRRAATDNGSYRGGSAQITRSSLEDLARSTARFTNASKGEYIMNKSNRISSAALLGAVLAWLCCGASLPAPVHGQTGPPPEGAGIVASLHSDQDAYTSKPDTVWCPPCVYENPPCMLPCYFVDGAAVAQFTFQVTNRYKSPRTYQFSSGRQFDVEII